MLFSDVWSENAALFTRLMKIHSNSLILYYGFNVPVLLLTHALSRIQDICGICMYTLT